MATHHGNSENIKQDRSLHRFRWPTSLWEWAEKSYVLLALAGMALSAFSLKKDDPFREWAFLTAFLLLFSIASVLSILLAWINGEKARYAEVLEHLHQSLHSIRDLDVYLVSQLEKRTTDVFGVKRRLQHDLITVLDRLTLAISVVSGVKAKIMLTQVVLTDNRLRVEVLARDSASKGQWQHQDNADIDHWVDENSSLRKIAVQKEVNYYHNPRVFLGEYDSSFFKAWPHDRKYKSCLVLPIRGKDPESNEHQYCGFIHIEGMSEKAFNTRYDVDISASIADSLYLILSNYATYCRQKAAYASI